ncbi:SMODS domain-containing nucleotidyltransferase [Paenibacillus larvae]|uniref:Adenylyl/Guanylyl and SMODS C-terminal sensor domain-containing protein n=1 Tax=Paenibacillus larvae subsp. larvae TaxID=147375 RepID=A0A6C0R065_9BACL|nr:nucleotidyltransferase [Paenibacillus larvae]QHZ54160.1 hypothetical protein ERICV_05176 [Paenibacillus larvae subsp. larvae]
MLENAFEDYCNGLEIDNMESISKRYSEIVKRLNKSFWDLEDDEEHGYLVGSIGRHTAIKGVSDLDMLFVLPDSVYSQYNSMEGNKQSKLLQAVKKEIKKRYPRTTVRGDGQVVVVKFDSINYIAEVCPGFAETDGSFTYPDSNDGGSWKKTDPIPEISASEIIIDETKDHFRHVCNMIRVWKNEQGFKFGGLLIDTLVYNFFNEKEERKDVGFGEYLELFKELFNFLKNQNEERKYWFALGSNQRVYNKKCKFVKKANVAYNKIKDLTQESDNLYSTLQEIFGESFMDPEDLGVDANKSFASRSIHYDNTEQFIQNMFPVDIRFQLRIDCEVTQNGFRNELLRKIKFLRPQKKLRFFIEENEIDLINSKIKDVEEKIEYEVYWKVLNRGDEAIRRNCIRGQIVKDEGRKIKNESSHFRGEHYVECYLISNGVCVARDRILVPISTW